MSDNFLVKWEVNFTRMPNWLLNFKDAKANFFSAARYGMATQFVWDNKYVST